MNDIFLSSRAFRSERQSNAGLQIGNGGGKHTKARFWFILFYYWSAWLVEVEANTASSIDRRSRVGNLGMVFYYLPSILELLGRN